MGILSFLKNVFGGEDTDEKELDEARARHGIQLTAKDKLEMDQGVSEEERFAEKYDVWEDLKHYRTTFFLGNWAAKKIHVIGEDKVKQQLEDLERKKQQEAEKKAAKEAEKALKKGRG